MPTENERKYVLDLCCENEISDLKTTKVVIEQGYTAFSRGMSLRVRKKQNSTNKRPIYFITYKQKVKNRTIEIENEIDERDFNDIWETAVAKVKKIRYTFTDDIGQFWEIDFLKKNNKTYFCLAEVELPEEQKEPKLIPKFVEENLLYEVPLNDSRFSNKKLSDEDYSIDLYKKAKKNELKYR